MKYRLWCPQLDPYDTIRRMSLILRQMDGTPVSREKLYICDFFVANPALLHKTYMTSEVRKKFYKLEIKKPEASFINYPPAPILFAKMAGTQRIALQNLIGRNLLSLDSVRSDVILLSQEGRNFAARIFLGLSNEIEPRLLRFICTDFASVAADQPGGLRAATGLRRIGQ
jgi:hypothetical protein